MYRGRGSDTTSKYLLAGKSMPWYAMALSIMATQASAITFISTTGQSYADGMRFIQMYFGLPIAMIAIAAIAVPRFHNSGVYTAYEYLEKRFDAKTRALVSVIFLLSRGLAVGVSLSAPAVVLTVILGWPSQYTTLLMGALVVAYTVSGGIQAVTWTDVLQMIVMTTGLFAALFSAIYLLPSGVHFSDALSIAGSAGRLNPVVWSFDLSDQYNVWSGLLGGTFLALAYFGCDQSQVQRYLTGRDITQMRLSLLFNAVAKIPMQFFILFTGAMVFVFFVYVKPPVNFNPGLNAKLEQQAAYPQVKARYDAAFDQRRLAAQAADPAAFHAANLEFEAARASAAKLAAQATGQESKDTNYIFLHFVTRYMPAGIVGLIMAAIFAAAMSTASAEVNSLATVSVIDVYQRFLKPGGSDPHYLSASRWLTGFWGIYAVITAYYAQGLGSLVEAVNKLGSLFYGSMLGVFVLAFFVRRVQGTVAFVAVLTGEAVVFAAWTFTTVAFLWLNVLGCAVVVFTGLLLSLRSGLQATPR
ncbi:MAG: sodium:solute symporter [Acidobacteria bacterium]|nr:sodium:solute symporter [Acidobacteriota bacterium]